jgi:hypothetical protein
MFFQGAGSFCDPALIFEQISPALRRRAFILGGKMVDFQAKRVTREYVQTNLAPPECVFPLLCPVREAEWVPDWRYRMIYSRSGVAELGCVFATPNDDGSETTWIVTEHDCEACSVGFVWIQPGSVTAQIRIRLEPADGGKTQAHVRYTYTALSENGNQEISRYDETWFRHKMESWEAAINRYLETGKCLVT